MQFSLARSWGGPARFTTALASVTIALLSVVLIPTGGPANANTPACGNSAHNTASGQGWSCSNGALGPKYDMLCTGNLRSGPSVGFAVHGTAIGSGINLYKDVSNGSAVNGGCGGPTTNEWYLSSNGWVSRSITTAAH
ncbi:MAG: hypothetical protein ACJ74O_00200 [Frankiaceae bacterium]